MSREEIWDSTPRELTAEFDAIRQQRQDAADRDLTLAWMIEALHRHKKLPALRSLLQRGRSSQPQSVKAQRAVLEVLSAQYGIPLRKVKTT